MKTIFLKVKQAAYELGVLFANTLTTGPVSNTQNKWTAQ